MQPYEGAQGQRGLTTATLEDHSVWRDEMARHLEGSIERRYCTLAVLPLRNGNTVEEPPRVVDVLEGEGREGKDGAERDAKGDS